jgi:phosphoribosylformylglycinamidine cyclo-ligase
MDEKITYKDAGVDTEEGARAVSLIKERVQRTFGPEVLSGLGSFAGLYRPDLSGLRVPVLVSGTDGVGTKLKVALLMDKHDTVGIDLVAMCVNDVLCHGARPMFFLDYIATGRVVADKVADIVRGVADGCEMAGCALIGGETAEMPGIYAGDDYDMAGFCVGMADMKRIVDGSGVSEGDLLIGIPSSGIHSNGFSLARKVLFDKLGLGVNDTPEGLDEPVGQALLTPTRIYSKQVASVMEHLQPKAMVHITGGGFFENIPRVIPDGLGVRIDVGTWKIPGIFGAIAAGGKLDAKEMFSTFNMGIGFIIVVPAAEKDAVFCALTAAEEDGAVVIGEVVSGDGVKLALPLKDRIAGAVVDGAGVAMTAVMDAVIALIDGV